jgi:hypothetical protein
MKTVDERLKELKIIADGILAEIQTMSDYLQSRVGATNNEQNEKVGSKSSSGSISGAGTVTGAYDVATGRPYTQGGQIVWNDQEISPSPLQASSEITEPTKGYHKHSHGEFSGGAIDVNTMMLVEYERLSSEGDDDDDNPIMNPKIKLTEGDCNEHCQSEFKSEPLIVKADKTEAGTENVTQVEKKGKVAWIFNAESSKWGCAAYEIDVKKCFLVQRDENGKIELDDSEEPKEKKSCLWNEDQTKTSVVWDKNAGCWRFYAAFAEEPEEPEEEEEEEEE